MAWRAGIGCVCVAVMTVSGVQAQAPPAIAVQLSTRSRTDIAVLAKARHEAERIFAAAGVRILWRNRPGAAAGLQNVSVAIIAGREADAMLPVLADGRRLLGRSALAAARGYIHYDRVVTMAGQYRVGSGVLLGRVLVHELVHLVARSGEHTPAGLMARELDPRDGDNPVLTSGHAETLRRAGQNAESILASAR